MKKYLTAVAILLVYLSLTLQACTNDELPESAAPSCDLAVPVTYDGEIKAIIDNSCAYAGCHGSGSPLGDLTNFDAMQGFINSGALMDRVITQREDTSSGMPPNNAPDDKPKDLTAEELLAVECWIDGGYLEN